MNCFSCGRAGKSVAAVALCPHCRVGLCDAHRQEMAAWTQGGLHYTCAHAPWSAAGGSPGGGLGASRR